MKTRFIVTRQEKSKILDALP